MRYALLAIILISISPARSQLNKEFEGVIKYQHKFRFNTMDADSLEIFKALGTSSVFYYKKGNYKWVYSSESNSNVEYFDSKTQTVYSLYGENDTLFMEKRNGHDDSLLLFKINDTDDTVCGLRCKKAETFSINKDDSDFQTKRILYYSTFVSIRPDRFSNYRTYATNKVVKELKCWPIKIELESKLLPFTFIIEAIEIIPKKLSDSEVYLPTKNPIKLLPLF
jgi:hypothetical protein